MSEEAFIEFVKALGEKYRETFLEVSKALDGKPLGIAVGVLFHHVIHTYKQYGEDPRFQEFFHHGLEIVVRETSHRPLNSNPLSV